MSAALDTSARPAEETAATAVCRGSIARGSKSFALASRLLPPDDADRAAVLYAYCRRADDQVDDVPAAEAPAACARLESELAAIYAGEPQTDPVLAAFAALVADRAIPRAYPAELLAGFAMDAAGARYDTLADLHLYAFRVAGVVGLMMCHLSGLRTDAALQHAAALGLAMQLTNIARDVAEDWDRGRLYLPADLLAEAGAPDLAADLGRPLPRSAGPALRQAVRALLAEADRLYRLADLGLPALPARWALTIRTARLVYAAIGSELARRDHDVFAGRAVVPRSRKLALAARALAQSGLDAPGHLARDFRGERPRPPRAVLGFGDLVLG